MAATLSPSAVNHARTHLENKMEQWKDEELKSQLSDVLLIGERLLSMAAKSTCSTRGHMTCAAYFQIRIRSKLRDVMQAASRSRLITSHRGVQA